MENLPNIRIVATGGTIAGVAEKKTQTTGYKAAKLSINELINDVTELSQIANITGEQFCQIASENMNPSIWLELAKRINELLSQDDIDGIVVTHGTDTLEETAYFLNLTIKSQKPVVLVGAMRPKTALSADGPLNLFNAVLVAANKASKSNGVLISLGDTILSAREATKTSTYQTTTFQGRGFGCVGVIVGGNVMYYYKSTKAHTFETEFDVSNVSKLPKVSIIFEFAGSGSEMVRAAVECKNDGIILACSGNGSINDDLREYIKSLDEKPVIVRSTRVSSGAITRNGEVNDDEFGTIAGDDFSPQKARILLMLALCKTKDLNEIQEFFYKY